MQEMAKKRKTRRSASHSALGCLFWASLIIALVIAAIAAREPLKEAFGKLFEQGSGASPTVVVKPLAHAGSEEVETNVPVKAPVDGGQKIGVPPSETASENAAAPKTQPSEAPREESTAVRKTRLFFASVDAGGKVEIKGVIRPIPSNDSPLRDTILALLKGPTSQEVNLGMLTMIPADSRLLGVAIRGETAFLDFSESFRFNTLGTEGLNAGLKQVVYAATEFPTVKNVQILIEGKKVQYLGSEGIRIDAPLDRESFTN